MLLHQVSLKKMPAKLAKRGFLGFSSKKRFSRCHRMTTELLQHLKGRKFFPCGPRTIFSSLFWIQKVAEACNFTKSNSPPWVFFTFFFKLYKWYQIAQSITQRCDFGICSIGTLQANVPFCIPLKIENLWSTNISGGAKREK